MISFNVGSQPDVKYARQLVAGAAQPIVTYISDYWDVFEKAFEGLLARPDPGYVGASSQEVRYFYSGPDGVDILDASCPEATSIGPEDQQRITRAKEALKAKLRTATPSLAATIRSFRLPDIEQPSQRQFFRVCRDPSAPDGKRLVIICGVSARDKTGALAEQLPLVAPIDPGGRYTDEHQPSRGDKLEVFDEGQLARPKGIESTAAEVTPMSSASYAAAGGSKCRCWIVAFIFLLLLAGVAALGYWWFDRELKRGRGGTPDDLAAKVADLSKSVGDMGKKLSEMDDRLSGRLSDLDKKLTGRLDDLEKTLTTRLDDLDKELAVTNEMLAATTDKVDGLALDVEKLTADVAKLNSQVQGLDSKLIVLHNNFDDLAAKTESDFGKLRANLLRMEADIAAMKQDIKTLFGFHKEGKPTPNVPIPNDPEISAERYEAIQALLKKGEPITQAQIDATDRKVVFPPGELPPGVVYPPVESKVKDVRNWQFPPNQAPFTAHGYFENPNNTKEGFTVRLVPGKESTVSPAPQVATYQYKAVNPDQQAFLQDQPGGGPPKIVDVPGRETPKTIEVDRTGIDPGGRPVEQDRLLVQRPVAGGGETAVFVLPIKYAWKRVGGDELKVQEDWSMATQPPALEPVAKVKTVTYDVQATDANGKELFHEQRTAVYEPK